MNDVIFENDTDDDEDGDGDEDENEDEDENTDDNEHALFCARINHVKTIIQHAALSAKTAHFLSDGSVSSTCSALQRVKDR